MRQLRTELIDSLPHDHPEAQWSRRDLVLINWLMGNWRWAARQLEEHARCGDRILELGAGAGEFADWLDRQGGRAANGRPWSLAGLDLAPLPNQWRTERDWFQTDLLAFDRYAVFDVVFAILTLHHFDDDQLRRLGERFRQGPCPRVIFATEPMRRRLHLWQARALVLTGANRVTRHDAPASVAAGFRGSELPELLGLRAPEWRVTMRGTFWGACRMVAVRRPAI